MLVQQRDHKGHWLAKGSEPRVMRAVRLTNTAWQRLADISASYGMSRADLIEVWASSNVSVPSGHQESSFSLEQLQAVAKSLLMDVSLVRPRDRAAVRRFVERLVATLQTSHGEQ